MTEQLQEYFDSRGVAMRVDRPSAVIRGVKVLGLESRNGRSYLPDALVQAASLYEDAKVNVNHPKGNPTGPRDYQDRIGVIRNVSVRPEEGLFADLHFNPKHALAEQLLWDAEHAPENVGFSHNVEAMTSRRGDRVVVEAITRVQSVDLVADPATTRGLFESTQSDDASLNNTNAATAVSSSTTSSSPSFPTAGSSSTAASSPTTVSSMTLKKMTLEELQRDYPELVERLCEETGHEIRRLREEVARLTASQRQSDRQETARRLLREHHLPEPDSDELLADVVTSREFFESLLSAPDEKAMRILVEERSRLVQSLAGHGSKQNPTETQPRSRDQYLVAEPRPTDVKSFVLSIT
jgi:hypothetical protein